MKLVRKLVGRESGRSLLIGGCSSEVVVYTSLRVFYNICFRHQTDGPAVVGPRRPRDAVTQRRPRVAQRQRRLPRRHAGPLHHRGHGNRSHSSPANVQVNKKLRLVNTKSTFLVDKMNKLFQSLIKNLSDSPN